jgi:hypothetical protein
MKYPPHHGRRFLGIDLLCLHEKEPYSAASTNNIYFLRSNFFEPLTFQSKKRVSQRCGLRDPLKEAVVMPHKE